MTRTQIGLGDSQNHSFVCPTCGVTISFTMDLDQEHTSFSYGEPKNADWTDDERGAIGAVALSQEIPVPVAGKHGFVTSTGPTTSPYLETFSYLEDWKEYRHSEELRLAFVRRYDEFERSIKHFERRAWPLFDAAMRIEEQPPTVRTRLIDFYGAIQSELCLFTRTPRSMYDRIRQRLVLANSKEPTLMQELGEMYVASGRMSKLWKEIAENRSAFISEYKGLQPLVQMRYWREELRDPTSFVVSTKRFDSLRQLYLNSFETLCRLLVIGKMVEAVIHASSLDIPLAKRSVTLEEFEAFPNAVKCTHFASMAIGDLFQDALDTDLRNGIGHHAAHYEADSDEVLYFRSKGSAVVEGRLSYTEFCNRLLQLFAVVELGCVYHHWLHISVDGRLA